MLIETEFPRFRFIYLLIKTTITSDPARNSHTLEA